MTTNETVEKINKEVAEQIRRVPQLSSDELINRFRHHSPKNDTVAQKHTDYRSACLELANYINEVVPEGREKALALTHLEEVMMWGNAGIARNS